MAKRLTPYAQWNSHATAPVGCSSFLTPEHSRGARETTCLCTAWLGKLPGGRGGSRLRSCSCERTQMLRLVHEKYMRPTIHSPICASECVCAWRHREIDSPARCYFRVLFNVSASERVSAHAVFPVCSSPLIFGSLTNRVACRRRCCCNVTVVSLY